MKSGKTTDDILKTLTVLHVEDDPDICKRIDGFLSSSVGTILTANTGVSGLEIFRTRHPHLVITDILMPEMDGLEMAAEIRKIDETVPIIITADPSELKEHLLRSIDTGVNKYIAKPVSPKRLITALKMCAQHFYTFQMLQENVQRFELAVASGRLGIWEWNIPSNVLIANDRIFEMYGVCRDSFPDYVQAWWQLMHPDDVKEVVEAIMATVRGEKEYNTDFRIVRPDGEIRAIKANGIVIRDADGKALRMIGLNRDITEYRIARKKLQDSEEKYRHIFDNVQDVYYETSLDGIILTVSPSIEAVSNGRYRPDNLIGRSIYDFYVNPEDRKYLVLQLLAHGMIRSFEISLRNGDNIPSVCAVSARLCRDADGHPWKIIGSLHDITEFKQIQTTLQTMNETLRALILASPVAIIQIDLDGRVLLWNPAAERLFGWSAAEVMDGENPIIPEDQRKTYWRESVAAGENVLNVERIRQCKDGSRIHVIISTASLRDKSGKVCSRIGMFVDISGRKRAEEAVLAKQQQLELLNRTLEARVTETVNELRKKDQVLIQQSRLAAMGEMIGNIAHQWRQPLNSLALVIANIKDAWDFNELNAEYMDKSVASCHRLIQKMSTTISDFFNFFRSDKTVVSFSAQHQIQETLSLVEASFNNNLVSVHLDTSHDVLLKGLPSEFSQALLNLLSNAKDAILAYNKGRKVTIRVESRGNMGCVIVSDSGGGIPEDILDKIFDPYFTTRDHGTGIGLYMSKVIIEHHMNGRIAARNIDTGAEFTVCVPLSDKEAILHEPS